LRNAIAQWYADKYGVSLEPDNQILPLIGSKEGIMHLCMTYLDKGDEVLVPNPGYPTYRSAVQLAGGTCVDYALKEATNCEPDFGALDQMDLSKVKMMWVNYPHMPSGHNGNTRLFEQLVAFGKKHSILICHDNPYSFILNNVPSSILSVPGAMDIAVELNSLSKSHNMAGWRVGMIAGSKQRIDEVLRFKSNMDSGMFLPVQLAAAKALQLDDSWYAAVNETYSRRRAYAIQLLEATGCQPSQDQVGMFLWARVPRHFQDGFAYSDHFLGKAHVFLTPGGIFGSEGNGFVRISLCSTEQKLKEAIERIKQVI
jgi:aspartate/methionine/tyrosine aminotransferase